MLARTGKTGGKPRIWVHLSLNIEISAKSAFPTTDNNLTFFFGCYNHLIPNLGYYFPPFLPGVWGKKNHLWVRGDLIVDCVDLNLANFFFFIWCV